MKVQHCNDGIHAHTCAATLSQVIFLQSHLSPWIFFCHHIMSLSGLISQHASATLCYPLLLCAADPAAAAAVPLLRPRNDRRPSRSLNLVF